MLQAVRGGWLVEQKYLYRVSNLVGHWLGAARDGRELLFFFRVLCSLFCSVSEHWLPIDKRCARGETEGS